MKGRLEGKLENNEKRLQKSESETSVLFYRQNCMEENVSKISQKVETLSSTLVTVSGEVKIISRKVVKNQRNQPVAYVCSDSVWLSLR